MTLDLVTGASGFIGQRLVARLVAEGRSVRALVRDPARAPAWPEAVTVLAGDVCDREAVAHATAGVDTVYHLAGRAHALAERAGEERLYEEVNVGGTRNVAAAAATAGARALVLWSSVKAMGEGGPEILDEESEARPATPYGRSKLAAEEVALAAGRERGVHVACLRLPLVYGPGNKGNLLRMMAAIDRGRFPPPPAADGRRSLVHVDNVIDAAMLAGCHPRAAGRCYLVADPSAYTTRELYELIARALGKRPLPFAVPLTLLRLAARLGDAGGRLAGRRLPFDSDALDKLVGAAEYSAARIARELGFRPRRDFAEALPELVAWYRGDRG